MATRGPTRPVVIANGKLARGRSAGPWQRTVEHLRSLFGNGIEICCTSRRGDAALLARSAVEAGADWLVAAGGDGTAHEAVNGLFNPADGSVAEVDVSFLPFGSGNDWARTLGIPMQWREAVASLTGTGTRRLDLGHAKYRGPGGATEQSVFLNMAEAGVGAAMLARLAERRGSAGSGRYLVHALAESIRYKPRTMNLEFDGQALGNRDAVLNLMAAGGRFFGGGIECAPMARPDDGMLEAIVIGDIGFVDLLWNLRSFVRGKYLGHPKVAHRSVRRLRADCGEAVPFELDGEIVGTLPVEITVLPQALRVRC